jgi:hypothetical protein
MTISALAQERRPIELEEEGRAFQFERHAASAQHFMAITKKRGVGLPNSLDPLDKHICAPASDTLMA